MVAPLMHEVYFSIERFKKGLKLINSSFKLGAYFSIERFKKGLKLHKLF